MVNGLEQTNVKLNHFEESLANVVKSTGSIQSRMGVLSEEISDVSADVKALRLDMETIRASNEGLDTLIASVEATVGEISANVTNVHGKVDLTRSDLMSIQSRLDQTDVSIGVLNTNVADNRNGLLLADDQFKTLRQNASTLKANIIGLGNYINNINGDVGKLSNTFEAYIGDMTETIVLLADNVTDLESTLDTEWQDLSKRVKSLELASTDTKNEIASLTTKSYDIKTAVFEQKTELSTLKADHKNLVTSSEDMSDKIKRIAREKDALDQEISKLKTDLTTLRTGLTSLTNSLFNLKNKLLASDDLSSQITFLKSNLSSISQNLDSVKSDLSAYEPKITEVSKDLKTVRTSIRLLAGDVSNQLNPPRFSCAVTSDEIRTSGVIKYNICNVNHEDIIDRDTGHATIKVAGDYFLSFSANMVSVNAQAVWCALYKQAAGTEGWQVLGMINNFQRNGNNIDDRDSGSLSVIASLQPGDHVWVEWRGYGDSFLYSNPYRLISFSGFLLKQV